MPGNILLAPLAGYTDAAFRSICLSQGACLCFTEMVSAEGLARGSAGTLALLARTETEALWGVQLFGADPAPMARAVRATARLGPSLYDLNCGCSVPKILKTGSGAALLRRPERIREIVAAMRGETDAPVTVKLRSGWDAGSLNFLQAAAAAVEGGASLVSLHPRTRSQGFRGQPDWRQIALLRREAGVPVLGSGDLFSAEDAVRMMRSTGCDGVLLARGALGNPFLFAQTRAAFRGEAPPGPVPAAQRLAMALAQLRLSIRHKGEATACREMRKHFAHYTRGVPGAAELRRAIVTAATLGEYEAIVKEFLNSSDALR